MSDASTAPPLRVGIVACASISAKTWAAVRGSSAAVVSVVGSRDAAKAEAWIAGCQKTDPFPEAPVACGSQTEVCAHPSVDAVYIPTPTNTHLPLVLAAATAKKQVVCEKPCVAAKSDLDAMLAACDAAGVHFFDGTMLTHGKRIQQVRQTLLEDGSAIGAVRQINAVFTFPGGAEFEKANIRTNPELEPLGALGDIGWYCIRYAFDAFGSQSVTPVRCRAETRAQVNGVPVSVQGDVEFRVTAGPYQSADVVRLSFYCSFREGHQQQITFLGSKAALRVHDFCLPFVHERETAFYVDQHDIQSVACRVDHSRNTKIVTVEESSTFQEEQLWRNVEIASKATERTERWAAYDRTWKAHEAVLTCLESARTHQGFVECRASPWTKQP